MSEIKSLVVSLIFTAIAISICELLVPKDSYKNQMRLITGTVLILSLISPFVSGIKIDDINLNAPTNDVEITYSTERAVATSINSDIQDILLDNDVKEGKVIIKTDFDEQGCIIIEQVIILFEEKDKMKSNTILEEFNRKHDFEIEVGDL